MNQSVPEYPTVLPGELWGVIAFYNPAGYANKLANLRLCAEEARAQGLKLLVVELAFGDSAFELPEDLCDRLVRRRTNTVLWQKERLLNIGVGHLPSSCDKVVWLDGDVLFENDEWVRETSRLLDTYVVVQPFDTACWLPKGMTSGPDQSDFGSGNREGQSLPGMAYTMARSDDKRDTLSGYFKHGHTGFAWAARRAVLKKYGLYDCQILGNGDFVMCHAMYGNDDFWSGRNWECDRLSPQLLSHIVEWSRCFYEDVRGSVFYVPGRTLHIWHGNQADRKYNARLLVLKECGFDPRTDLILDENDCWTWSGGKPTLEQWAADYFRMRREE